MSKRVAIADRIFHKALQLPIEARPAFCAQECREDAALLAHVEYLLARGVPDTTALDALVHKVFAHALSLTTSGIASSILDATGGRRVGSAARQQEQFSGTERFRVIRELGAGGFGTVYECYDTERRESVALKVLRRFEPELLLRFKQEFRRLVSVRHSNVVVMYDLFGEPDRWYFTMELVRGADFLSYVRALRSDVGGEHCDMDRLLGAALQVAEGLMAVHGAGLVHCDLKPANVLVAADGVVRLVDFGLVREAAASSTGTVVGTPAYMSPEQALGRHVDSASDWYSFGVMLVQALTGELPRGGWEPDAPSEAPVVRDLLGLAAVMLRHDPRSRPEGPAIVAALRRLPSHEPPAAVAAPQSSSAGDVLVGRDALLSLLNEQFESLQQGRPIIVNLSGPPGVGKSTIVREWFRRVGQLAPHAILLRGRCHFADHVPFNALDEIIDALSKHLRSASEAFASSVAPRDTQALLRAFPVLSAVRSFSGGVLTELEVPSAPDVQDRAFGALVELLSRLGERRSLVLAIDDVHWGDGDSIAFLASLLSAQPPPRMLLVASYRGESSEDSPFLRDWWALCRAASMYHVVVLEVPALTDDEARALTRALAERELPVSADVVDAIVRESAGSPFLIEQWVADVTADQRAASSEAVTLDSIRRRRLTMLAEVSRRLLETVALVESPVEARQALEAAGMVEGGAAAIRELVTKRLLRVRTRGTREELEVAHEVLRDEIRAGVSPSTRRDRHLALARGYLHAEPSDPARGAWHLGQAGDAPGATRHLLRAAEQAEQALAFERAAHLYALALKHLEDGPEADRVRERLAHAHAYSGRGPDAAEVFLACAMSATPAARSSFTLKAAEQLLRSGHTERGLALLKELAQSLGVRATPRPWQALASMLRHGCLIAIRGLTPRTRPEGTSDVDSVTLDVLWSLTSGLGLTDVIRGCDMQSRHLLLALRCGHREHAAVSMAGTAASVTAFLGRESGVSRTLRARAHALAADATTPGTRAVVASFDTMAALLRGDWAQAQELGALADVLLRDARRAMAWERANNDSMVTTAALLRGEWERLVRQAMQLPQLVDEARRRGDVHTLHFHLNGVHLGHLVIDRPHTEDALYEEIFRCLPPGYYLPHLSYLLARVDTALYRGDFCGARATLHSDWPALSQSLMLRVEHLRVLAYHARGRASVAAALITTSESGALQSEALDAAKRMERTGKTWAAGLAASIRAGVATLNRDDREALRLLDTATHMLERVGMTHLVAACRYRRAQLSAGTEARVLRELAEAWAKRVGVVQPALVFDVLVPGSWPSSTQP